MDFAWQAALLGQQALTALSSGFNAYHFLGYRSSRRRRRWGAAALALVNLAMLVQSLYLGILPTFLGHDSLVFLLQVRLRLAVGVLPLTASLLITAFVLRQRSNGRR